jgi:hypothetical protein
MDADERGCSEPDFPNKTMRAKLKISTVTRTEHGQEILKFHAVAAKSYPADGSDEDNTFAKYSPCAQLEITIANPALIGQFNPGETFYVDFTKIEKPAEESA